MGPLGKIAAGESKLFPGSNALSLGIYSACFRSLLNPGGDPHAERTVAMGDVWTLDIFLREMQPILEQAGICAGSGTCRRV